MPADIYYKMMDGIDRSKSERISKFHRWQDGHAALFAELLIRMILVESNGLKNSDITFDFLPNGKPFLTGYPHINFNLSHSGKWVVCATDSRSVGIDIEEISAIDLSVAETFFCPAEYKDILSHADSRAVFFEYWTLKESYIKFLGEGLSHSLNAFCLKYLPDKSIGLEVNGGPVENIYFRQYCIAEEYKMAVCAEHNGFSEQCIFYSTEQIISTFNNL